MKNHCLLFLSIIISTCYLGEAKCFSAGLRDGSESICVGLDLTKRVLGHATLGATTLGGLMYGYLGILGFNQQEIILKFSAVGAFLLGIIAYQYSETPKSVYRKVIQGIEEYQTLLHTLQKEDLNSLDFIKEYYIAYQLPLLASFNDLNGLLYNFNLYVNMMENARILKSLSIEQQEKYFELVPIVKLHIKPLMRTILLIKAQPEFNSQIANHVVSHALQSQRSAKAATEHAAFCTYR